MSVESERDGTTNSPRLLWWRQRDPASTESGGDLGVAAEGRLMAKPARGLSAAADSQRAEVEDPKNTPGLERLLSAICAVGKRWQKDRSTAGTLYQELMAEEPARRAELIASDPRFASPALAEELLAEACETARNRPAAAREHAEVALVVIERIDARRYGGGAVAGLRVAAQARRAEALWWGGDSRAADAALLGALDDVEETPIAGLERALYCRVASLVRAGQGRTDEALALLGRATQIYYQEQETAALGECLMEQGWLLAEADPQAAIAPFQRALGVVDPVARPWEDLRVRQGLAHCHAELGDGSAAEPMLRQSRQLRKKLSDEADFLRALQAEGQIEARLGRLDRAMELLRLALEGWLGRGKGFLAALSVIDLAELYADTERRAELAALEALGPRLEAAGLSFEATIAVRVVMRLAAREGVAAVYPLAHLRAYLSRARHDPALVYGPSRRATDLVAWDELPPERRRAVCERVGVEAEVGDRQAVAVPSDLKKLVAWTYQEVSGVEIEWDGLDALRVGLGSLEAAVRVVLGEIRAIQDRVPARADSSIGATGGEERETSEPTVVPGAAIDGLIADHLERMLSQLKSAAQGRAGLDPCA
jgi:tetratricopeptide (TPR) repeat protein